MKEKVVEEKRKRFPVVKEVLDEVKSQARVEIKFLQANDVGDVFRLCNVMPHLTRGVVFECVRSGLSVGAFVERRLVGVLLVNDSEIVDAVFLPSYNSERLLASLIEKVLSKRVVVYEGEDERIKKVLDELVKA